MRGFVRLAVSAACLATPGAALAEACEKIRPDWDGTPATAITEALHLAASLPSVVLILGTALALRFRSQWGGLAAVAGWSFLVSIHVFPVRSDPVRQMALTEGCIGSPSLFIAVVAAICMATVLYTAPTVRRSND